MAHLGYTRPDQAIDAFYAISILGLIGLKKAGFGPRDGTSTAQEFLPQNPLTDQIAVCATLVPSDRFCLSYATLNRPT